MQRRFWWQTGVIYQIYPRSFQDSNGDGVGDLNGILDRVDYLSWLGVDTVWISPVYPSPMADFGYDVADYVDIDPIFGARADFDRLVKALHERGIRVILDFVPNHTSDKHPWFQEARMSRDSPRRDWYIWRDPRPDGGPPNNWLSVASGDSAWEFDRATGQYYYHAFLIEQPDLNWRNSAVRAAMYDVLRFWLDRGVDGFRVDTIWRLIKDAAFRDNPANPNYREGDAPFRRLLPLYSADQPEVLEIAAEMRRVLAEYPGDRLLKRGTASIALQPKAFDALVCLVRGAEHMISKQELSEALWPDVHVSERNLTNLIVSLRKILGHDAIRTVSKHGYRFELPVSGEPGVRRQTYEKFMRARELTTQRSLESMLLARDLYWTCLAENPNFDGTIYLIAAADEEMGSELGIIYLVEECGIRFDVAIIPDGGKMNLSITSCAAKRASRRR